ncbi:phosphate/phosphite/phosphonate ABC transporter substrate-binding protein [Aliterella atlantica]|uniref:phosphate/phosphite/phosphonate ABC transporter substrate-binding protein n=1 Tax=Aliterella atlantica TaxID=1827278 RepID=UPI000696C1C2|nr:PhnD/SsuA/transferrin family substrate-binding protein [Aliterella atlantica]
MKFLKDKSKLTIGSALGIAIALVGVGAFSSWQSSQACPNKGEKKIWNNCYKDLRSQPLVIGVAIPPQDADYLTLALYLQKQLKGRIKVDRDAPYSEISQRIVNKTWDVAFTRFPLFSIAAEDNGYVGVATMFPESTPYYRSALYVRSDSSIESIADINAYTTIALGSPESAPTFHLPIYTLYGKTMRVGTGYSPREAMKLVKAGKVDIAASRYDNIKGDRSLRIIHVSKAIPGAGVYLSPKLASEDREKIKKLLLNAPEKVRSKANYNIGQIPNYGELRKIVNRTNTIVSCPGFDVKSLNLEKTTRLFCQQQKQKALVIEGKVTEYKVVTAENVELKVLTPDNQTYIVTVSKQTLNQIPIDPIDAVDELIQLRDITPQRIGEESWRVVITEPEQLALLSDFSLD